MKKNVKVYPMAMVYYENNVYISDMCSNALYTMSFEEKTVKYLTQFNNECSYKKRLYASIVVGDKKVFCIPFDAEEMGIYDIKRDIGYSVSLPNKIGKINGGFKIGIYHKQNIYLLGYIEKNVWIYDIKLDSWDKVLIPESKGLFVAGCIKDDYLYIVSKISSNIFCIDCKNKRSEIIDLNLNEEGFSDIKTVGNNLLIVSYDKNRIYEVCGKKVIRMWETKNDFSIWPHGGGILGKDGDYYFVSTLNYNLKKISMKNGDLECIEIEQYNSKAPCSLISCGDYIVIWLYKTSEIIKYNIYNKNIKKLTLITSKKPKIQFKKNENILIEESSMCELEDFIRLI